MEDTTAGKVSSCLENIVSSHFVMFQKANDISPDIPAVLESFGKYLVGMYGREEQKPEITDDQDEEYLVGTEEGNCIVRAPKNLWAINCISHIVLVTAPTSKHAKVLFLRAFPNLLISGIIPVNHAIEF